MSPARRIFSITLALPVAQCLYALTEVPVTRIKVMGAVISRRFTDVIKIVCLRGI